MFGHNAQWHIWSNTNTACQQKHKIAQNSTTVEGWWFGLLRGYEHFAIIESTLNLSVYQSIAECLKKKKKLQWPSQSLELPTLQRRVGQIFFTAMRETDEVIEKNGYFKLLPLKVVLQATESWWVLSFIRLHRVLWKLSFSNDCRAEGIKDQSL